VLLSDVRPNVREAQAVQVAAIAGQEPSASFYEVRWRTARGMAREFFPCDRAGRVRLREVVHALGLRGDTYLGAAPRIRRDGRRSAIQRVWTLWADLDGDEGVAALEKFQPAPTIVIATGTGSNRHARHCLVRRPGLHGQRPGPILRTPSLPKAQPAAASDMSLTLGSFDRHGTTHRIHDHGEKPGGHS
jgi:hypothetical protein